MIIEPKFTQQLVAAPDTEIFLMAEEIVGAEFCGMLLPALVREHVSVQSCRFVGSVFSDFVLPKSSFVDVVFRNCDLSNADLSGCNFHRVEFVECKIVGTLFAEATFRDVAFLRCKGEYVNCSFGRFRSVRFEECCFRNGTFDSCKFEKVEYAKCDLTMAEFHNTRLKGLSFADSVLRNIRVQETLSLELKGLKISALQAIDLVHLLGVEVEE